MTATCTRRGCSASAPAGLPACAKCWSEVPADEQRRIFALGRAGRYGARDSARKAAIRALPPKRPGFTPVAAVSATTAYARTSALLGERD